MSERRGIWAWPEWLVERARSEPVNSLLAGSREANARLREQNIRLQHSLVAAKAGRDGAIDLGNAFQRKLNSLEAVHRDVEEAQKTLTEDLRMAREANRVLVEEQQQTQASLRGIDRAREAAEQANTARMAVENTLREDLRRAKARCKLAERGHERRKDENFGLQRELTTAYAARDGAIDLGEKANKENQSLRLEKDGLRGILRATNQENETLWKKLRAVQAAVMGPESCKPPSATEPKATESDEF